MDAEGGQGGLRDERSRVGAALTEAVAATFAVPVVAARFYEPGVGVVIGLELADGRAVVAKMHRATFIPLERLVTIAHVQTDLVAAGVPAPAPLAGPLVLGDGWLTVEEHRAGDSADGYGTPLFAVAWRVHFTTSSTRPAHTPTAAGSAPGSASSLDQLDGFIADTRWRAVRTVPPPLLNVAMPSQRAR